MAQFKIPHPEPSYQRTAPPSGGRTRSPRRQVLVEGVFHSLVGTYPIGIKNLSCTGALIETAQTLTIGSEGVLASKPIDCFCRVMWTEGRLYGLQFDAPLPIEIVLQLHRVTGEDLARSEAEAAEQWWRNQAP